MQALLTQNAACKYCYDYEYVYYGGRNYVLGSCNNILNSYDTIFLECNKRTKTATTEKRTYTG